jgi:hypothetical protein
MRNRFKRLLLTVTTLALLANMIFPVMAQNPTGAIRGMVTDPQGAVVTNATVTVTSKTTGEVRKTNTGGDGIYAAENLLPGEYEVKIEAQNFSTQVITAQVQVGNTTSGDASLRIGARDEVVEVQANAPVINKEDYKIDGVITRQKVDALPLNGRNFLQLALLEPGVAVSAGNPGAQNNLFNVSIGGGPASLTRITVDGGNIVDPVCGGASQNFSTETIQEFQISTFNFDLSTGITSVGAVNIVSRTGGNEFHGNAFLFYRDHSFAALPTFFRPDANFDPFFRRYQWGGSAGGPIKKDKILFFGNIERLDQNAAISSFITGFAPLNQFSTVLNSPYKGWLTNVRVDMPAITKKNNLFVRYSRDQNDVFAPDEENTLPSNWRVNKNRDDNGVVGLSTVFNANVVNDFRFNANHIVNDETIPTSAECPDSNVGCIGLGGPQIRVVDSNLRIGNTINAPQSRDLRRFQYVDNLSWQKGAHRLRFGGEFEHGYGFGGWAFLDPGLIVVHNPATVLGLNATIASVINSIPNQALPPAAKAAIIAGTTLPVPANFTTPGAKITVQDLLGLPVVAGAGGGVILPLVGIGDPSQPPLFQTENARRTKRFRFYGQDSWLIKPGFTLSFGASYQFETNLQNHDLTKPALLAPLIGDLDKPGKDSDNIAPSFGFAWDVGNKGKTVIRGGAGIYYDTILFVTRLRERAAIGPLGNGRSQVAGPFFTNNVAFPQIPVPAIPGLPLALINVPLGTPIAFSNFPTKFTGQNFLNLLNTQVPAILNQFQQLGSSGLTNIDFFKTGTDLLAPDLQNSYSEQFSLGVQRQLPHNMSVSADFVLRKRLHVLFQNDFNHFNRITALGGPVIPRCTPAQASNPAAACSNGPISVIQSGGRDQYKALLVKVDKRFENRFQFTASYALSSLTTFFTGEDNNDWFAFHGPAGADARHRLTVSGVVELPWGFQTSVIAVYASRPPFNARVSGTIDINGDGTTGDTLPGLDINSLNRGTSKQDFLLLVNQFNVNFAGKLDSHGITIPAAVVPTDFSFGDDFQSEDVRVTKTVKFRERLSIQGFVEVFNIFNISNLTGYGSTLNRDFGLPTVRAGQNFGTGGPRAFQFGGRFSF